MPHDIRITISAPPIVPGTDVAGVVLWTEGRAFVTAPVARAIAETFGYADAPAWLEFPNQLGDLVRVRLANIRALVDYSPAASLAAYEELEEEEPLFV